MIYVPTFEELQIFHPYTETNDDVLRVGYQIFDKTLEGILDIFYMDEEQPYFSKLRMAACIAEVDPGFIGEGPDNYILSDNEKIVVESYSSDYGESYVLNHYVDDFEDELVNDCSLRYGPFSLDNNYGWVDINMKAYMFRLVLCWMRQQENKRLATFEEEESS